MVSWLLFLPLGLACFALATIVFDLLHFLLHRFMNSRHALLRYLGGLHQTHHQFLDRSLDIHREYTGANLRRHVIPEFITQVLVTALFLPVLPLPAVCVAWGIEVLVFVLILRLKGFDVNHRQVDYLHAYRPLYFCVPEYHCLHHIYPDAHFSSWIKTLDHLLQTGVSLRKRIAVAGKGGVESQLSAELAAAGAEVLLVDVDAATPDLDAVQVLVLGPSLVARPQQQRALVEVYARAARASMAPREVWAFTDGDQAHGSVLPALHASAHINYRHILCPDIGDITRSQLERIMVGIRKGYNLVVAEPGVDAWRRVKQFARQARFDESLEWILGEAA